MKVLTSPDLLSVFLLVTPSVFGNKAWPGAHTQQNLEVIAQLSPSGGLWIEYRFLDGFALLMWKPCFKANVLKVKQICVHLAALLCLSCHFLQLIMVFMFPVCIHYFAFLLFAQMYVSPQPCGSPADTAGNLLCSASNRRICFLVLPVWRDHNYLWSWTRHLLWPLEEL